MALNYRKERAYAARLGDAADELQTTRRQLVYSIANINSSYASDEAKYVLEAMEDLSSRIKKAYQELDSIESDIRSEAYQIYLDDREKERARERRRRRALGL